MFSRSGEYTHNYLLFALSRHSNLSKYAVLTRTYSVVSFLKNFLMHTRMLLISIQNTRGLGERRR